jgi:hypothetical protein
MIPFQGLMQQIISSMPLRQSRFPGRTAEHEWDPEVLMNLTVWSSVH